MQSISIQGISQHLSKRPFELVVEFLYKKVLYEFLNKNLIGNLFQPQRIMTSLPFQLRKIMINVDDIGKALLITISGRILKARKLQLYEAEKSLKFHNITARFSILKS